MFFKHYFLAILLLANSSVAAVVIQSSIDDGAWKKATAIYPLKGQKLTLKVAKESGATIRWYQIFPDISKNYKNANYSSEKNPYQWIGFGKIDYERQELTQFRDQWQIQPFEKQYDRLVFDLFNYFWKLFNYSRFYQKDVGSFWFQVEIEKRGKIRKSPGIENSDNRGLSPKVFRVSIRDGSGYLGYLTSFFNVPGIFGSTSYQSKHYIGVDCADVLVVAYSKWKGKPLRKNYNVAMLVNQFPKRGEFDLVNGEPSKEFVWGKDIRPGDLIAVRYPGARQYQHVGALSKDANNNGVLDGEDSIIHAGPIPLHYSYMKGGSFNGHIVILRLSDRLFRR